MAIQPDQAETVIEIRNVTTQYGSRVIHDSISADVYRNEILAIVGGSGSGKSSLLRYMLMIQTPASGSVRIFGTEVTDLAESETLELRERMGVLFQYSALFGSLTVLENVGVALREHTKLNDSLIDEIATLKIALAELPPESASLYPSQLSGGMRKRAAMARAIAMDPELLFLDEPNSGLDPLSANALDDLILELRESLGLTVVMVTHDMDSLWHVADRVIFLGDTKVLASGSIEDLARSDVPMIREFFQGPRGRAANSKA